MTAAVVPVADPAALSSKAPTYVRVRAASFDQALREFGASVRALAREEALAGQVELELAEQVKPLLRQALEKILQAQADKHGPFCPHCGAPLKRTKIKERTLRSQWGEVTLRRVWGYCAKCKQWSAPADHALALTKSEQNTPAFGETLAYLGTKLPAAEAAEVVQHVLGDAVAPSRVERQTRRAGEEALQQRDQDVEAALSTEERHEFARRQAGSLPAEDFALLILIDGWMLRERDHWGQSAALRSQGQDPKRWHETKTARIYRLPASDWHEGAVANLKGSNYVATRGDAEVFSERVWTEALRSGLLQAKRVLVVADGGAWIWNIAKDRFSFAEGTLDFYHACQHLYAVAQAVFGENTQEARAWFEPLRHQLRHGGEAGVLASLADLKTLLEDQETLAVAQRETDYFERHRDHLAYQHKAQRGEPIGSGAIESACKQYQVRFKRGGQFWGRNWDEGLLELKSRQLAGRWDDLWPHRRPHHQLN
jgi:hypothetical protein